MAETNEQFARRMRARRNGVSYEEQKRREFAEPGLFEINRVDEHRARELIDALDRDPEKYVAMALRDLGLEALRSAGALQATPAEPFSRGVRRAHDALWERFPQLRGPLVLPERHAPTDLMWNTVTGVVRIDSADTTSLLSLCSDLGLPTRTREGWLSTAGELIGSLEVYAGEQQHYLAPSR